MSSHCCCCLCPFKVLTKLSIQTDKPKQTVQAQVTVAYDWGLHSLLLIQQFSDTDFFQILTLMSCWINQDATPVSNYQPVRLLGTNSYTVILKSQLILICTVCKSRTSVRTNMVRFFLIDCVGVQRHATVEGHFVSSPREKENRYRRDSRDERGTVEKEENEWKWRNRRNKNIPPLNLPATRIAGLAQL